MLKGRKWQSFLIALVIYLPLIGFFRPTDAFSDSPEDGWITVEMQVEKSERPFLSLGGISSLIHRRIIEDLDDVGTLPEFRSSKPLLGKLYFLRGEMEVLYALDEEGGDGTGYNLLYLDTSLDGNLVDETPISTQAEVHRRENFFNSKAVFDEIALELDDRTIFFRTEVTYQEYGTGDKSGVMISLPLEPSRYMKGEVELGGHRYQLALVDADLSGRYSDFGSKSGDLSINRNRTFNTAGTQLLVDLNRDGVFDRCTHSSPERMLLGRYLRVGDEFYEIQVELDGSIVRFREAKDLPTGKVRIPLENYVLNLLSEENGSFTLSGEEEIANLPVGDYRVHTLWFTQEHEGRTYSVLARGMYETPLLRIREGETTDLPVGPPLFARGSFLNPGIARNRGERHLIIGFDIVGSGRELYTRLDVRGPKPDPPTFTILSERGTIVQRGHFELGQMFRYKARWIVPPTMEGRHRLLVHYGFGPFDIRMYRPQEIDL